MSLAEGFRWTHGDWIFQGYTLAGITTSIYCKTASVCFDVGQGLPFQLPAKNILITHGHLDHAAGIPYLISQKNMNSQENATFWVPEALHDPLLEILRLWQGVDDFNYKFQIRTARPGELIDLDKSYCARPFATPHRVPSQGYLLFQKRKKLRAEFAGASREEILRAKGAGEELNESVLEPVVAFTGDTQIEFLSSDPEIARAKILFVEATFWDNDKPVEHARRWGHIHLDEVIDALPRLQNEKIVLIHASVRYTSAYLEQILQRRLTKEQRERVVLFPRPL